MIDDKQVLNRCFAIGNKGIKGKIFLESDVFTVIATAIVYRRFRLSFIVAAAFGFGEQGYFFQLSTAVMRHKANTYG